MLRTLNQNVNTLQMFSEGEQLAHKLAYALNDSMDKTIIKPFANSVTFRREDEYQVLMPQVQAPHGGLVYYFLVPRDARDNTLHIVFRGTADVASTIRDMEWGAPGSTTFKNSQEHLLLSFSKVLEEFALKHRHIAVIISGHSLGGADAQRFMGELLRILSEYYETETSIRPLRRMIRHFEHVSDVRLICLNSPGIATVEVKAAQKYASLIQGKINMESYWLHVGGDAIQEAGQKALWSKHIKAHMLNPLPRANAEVGLWAYLSYFSTLIFQTAASHASVHFQGANDNFDYHYYCSDDKDHGEVIYKKLQNKNSFLQYTSVEYVKVFFAVVINLIHHWQFGVNHRAYNPAYDKQLGSVFDYEFIPSAEDVKLWRLEQFLEAKFENYLHPRLTTRSFIQDKYDYTHLQSLISEYLARQQTVIDFEKQLQDIVQQNQLVVREQRWPQITTPVFKAEQRQLTVMPEPMRDTLLAELNKTILARSLSSEEVKLNLYSRFFRSPALTTEKLTHVLYLKEYIATAVYIEDVILRIEELQEINKNRVAEHRKNKTLLFKTHDGFNRCMENLREIVNIPGREIRVQGCGM